MSGGQISLLFGIWSLTGFVLEVPSGALADRVPRRHLLVVAEVIRALGFACWLLWPTFTGFALGFVLWGVNGALSSGTWEALVYDELTRLGAADRYARILGRCEALAATGTLAGTALAGPLLALGGYRAAGWASVAACLLCAALTTRLPAGSPLDADADADSDVDADEPGDGYFATLRAGVTEAVRNRAVGLLVASVVVLSGATAIEEYFSLLAVGLTSVAALPYLLLVPELAYALGAEAGGRLAGLAPRWVAGLAGAGAIVLAAGALIRHPAGFVLLSVGYGALGAAIVVASARLQDTLTGPRATVTSVSAIGEEVVALIVYAVFGAASGAVSLPVLCALAALPVVVLALRLPRWLPRA
ncbi:MFS transporter [Cryptosporangium phraense]|uniref:MFS transporter n=2 Tax=Cryptosporangium phraense TaxID=2593070 RepID=A0A545AES7_9ACTN|nr:MFS transporter [Cryptosporangium phraense]